MTRISDTQELEPTSSSHRFEARRRMLAELPVRRVLPQPALQAIGPFLFFDHFGPRRILPGRRFRVPPHPHVGLATITVLLDGEMRHLDSLGNDVMLAAGGLNYMNAGNGIVHAEETRPWRWPRRLHGLQLWLALDDAGEDQPPTFRHYPEDMLPEHRFGEGLAQVLMGRFHAVSSPVPTHGSAQLVLLTLPKGAGGVLPPCSDDRALYVIDGTVQLGGDAFAPGQLRRTAPGEALAYRTEDDCRLLLLAGASPGVRHRYWNFVSREPARLAEAAERWRKGEFPAIPGQQDSLSLPD